MGPLVEQAIPTLFEGVSRQPAAVRRVGQVESADNVLLSVVTGGFEKRPPSQLIAFLDFVATDKDYKVHAIDRDPTEQIFLLITSTGIQAVNTITGAEITVTVDDSTRYFLVEQKGLDSTGVVQIDGDDMDIPVQFDSDETTLDWSYTSSSSSLVWKLQGSSDGTTWVDLVTGKTGSSGTFSTTIGGTATGDHNHIRVNVTTAAGSTDTLTLKATFKDLTYLLGADPEDFQAATVADTTFIVNRTVTARLAAAGSGSIKGTKQEFTDLPTATGSGDIWRITGTDVDGFGTYYVKDDADTSTWKETVNPNAHNDFDASSMPHQLKRNTDGSFTFKAAAWIARPVGDEDITEAPKFVNKDIQDVAFYRNRLVILADEQLYTSKTGDVFNMWPDKAVQTEDTDPVLRAATTDDINNLKFATTFGKLLFCTSERAQFELRSDGSFTNGKATFDLSTRYAASPIAKPVALGNVLYFAAKTNDYALLYEYYLDEVSLTSQATDVTKHIVNYIPNDILNISVDTATGTVFVLTTGEQNSVFTYRTFFDGTTKLQSAWARYKFGETEAKAFIHGQAVFSGYLVLLIQRDDGAIYLEQIPVEREAQNETVKFSPFLDQREVVTGTYESDFNATYWDLSFEHNDDAQIILGPAFTEPGRQPSAHYPNKYVLDLTDVAAGETIVINGKTFTAHADTTTLADREFSIEGTDTADAGELVSCINDATYGVPGVTATDNSDGSLTIIVDDKINGSIAAPTGTAIDNDTILSVKMTDIVAASGDLTAGLVWVGRPYTMSVELSEIFYKKPTGESIITGRLQLRDISFLLGDAGYLKATVKPLARDAYEYTFEGKVLGSINTKIGSASIAESATFKVPIWSRSTQVTITLSSDQPVPCVVTSAAWRGFFTELSRQE